MFGALIGGISAAAKGLFSGANREARKERKALKQAANQQAKAIKTAAKEAIQGGDTVGAKVSGLLSKVWFWIKTNWMMIAIILGAILVVWFMFFKKRKIAPRRRRASVVSYSRPSRRGTGAMKARMAKVRAARKRRK